MISTVHYQVATYNGTIDISHDEDDDDDVVIAKAKIKLSPLPLGYQHFWVE